MVSIDTAVKLINAHTPKMSSMKPSLPLILDQSEFKTAFDLPRTSLEIFDQILDKLFFILFVSRKVADDLPTANFHRVHV